jgi:phage terminase large subunit-like protein
MANARVVSDAASNRKLDKMKATGRIDGAVAVTMALGAIEKEDTEGDMQGFLSNPIVI